MERTIGACTLRYEIVSDQKRRVNPVRNKKLWITSRLYSKKIFAEKVTCSHGVQAAHQGGFCFCLTRPAT